MSEQPSPELLAAIQSGPQPQANGDRLTTLRDAVRACRDLEQEKTDLEERLTQTNVRLQEYYFKLLPDLLDEVGIPLLALEPEGNNPGVVAEAKPYYRANIPADWPPERRAAAFAYLAEEGASDLIKTDVTTSFPRGGYEDAVQFAAKAQAETGQPTTLKEAVAWATLTSWLKESVEKHGQVPDLDKIGGTVGRKVTLKPLKEK